MNKTLAYALKINILDERILPLDDCDIFLPFLRGFLWPESPSSSTTESLFELNDLQRSAEINTKLGEALQIMVHKVAKRAIKLALQGMQQQKLIVYHISVQGNF